ncbi:MAG: hypothetical protein ACI9YL_000705 [Luteibaculaceae bacterium]|jgi:hypothetical protein
MKKILLLLLLPFLGEILISCCSCLTPIDVYFTHKAVDIKLFQGDKEIIDGGSINILADNIHFRLIFELEKAENLSACNSTPPSFFSKLNATSCRCPPEVNFIPITPVSNIHFTSSDSLSPKVEAGKNILDQLEFTYHYHNLFSSEDLINIHNNVDIYYWNQSLDSNHTSVEIHGFDQQNNNTIIEGVHRMYFEIETISGDVFSDSLMFVGKGN